MKKYTIPGQSHSFFCLHFSIYRYRLLKNVELYIILIYLLTLSEIFWYDFIAISKLLVFIQY